jgi:hypothetical protein
MRLFVFFVYLALFTDLKGQTVKSVLEAMSSLDQAYMEKSFAQDMAFYMDQSDDPGSRAGGFSDLKTFLAAHRFKSYKLIHEGVAKGKEGFMGIGSIVTDKARYRIYIVFKSVDNKSVVSEVRLEKELQ